MPLRERQDYRPNNDVIQNAATVSKNAGYAASSLYLAFMTIWEQRGARRGATTDQEQDLLRSMLVLACAGLDSTLKQLIRSVVPAVASRHSGIQKQLESFISKRLRDPDGENSFYGTSWLAKLLLSDDTHRDIVSSYIYELTGDSLQSFEQILKTSAALGIENQFIIVRKNELREIFSVRNKIIHEMDIDFTHHRRRRASRREEDMVGWTDTMLDLCAEFVTMTDRMITELE